MERVSLNNKFEVKLPEKYLREMNVKSGDILILKYSDKKIFCHKE